MKEDRLISKDNAKQHFENNKNDLAKRVFQKEKIDKNEYQKYSKAVEMIDGIIDVLSLNTKLLYIPTISENLLIVALQCYINIDRKTQVDNHFYGYNTSDQKSLHSEMKYGIQAFKKNQLAIVKYIYDTYYFKCGKDSIRNVLYIFENYVDSFIKSLMHCSSVNQMLHMYFNSIWHIRSILYTNYHITNCLNYINNNLLYDYVIDIDKSILQRFIAILDTGNILIYFINNLNLLLISSVFSKTEEIYVVDDELGVTSVYECLIRICFISKRISIKGLKLNRIEKNETTKQYSNYSDLL